MTKILVTGGTGFIGSNLVYALVKNGNRVRVFDNNFRGKKDNLKSIWQKIEFIKGDITKKNQVQKAVKGIDTIFHLAYINGTEYFYSKPQLVLEVGIKGTVNVLDSAISCNVKNFIFASSSEIYQTPAIIPTPEEVPAIVPDVKNPRYSYGGGKIIGEILTLHYTKHSPMRKIIFRPHNIYGPHMGWEHVIPQLLAKIYKASRGFKKNEAVIEIQGNGQESRSFCYIDDAVSGIILCSKKGKDGEIYNVGKREEVTITYLISQISDILGINVKIKTAALQKGSTLRRCPDITKLQSLGYKPLVSLRKGLEMTIASYKEELDNEKI